MYEWYKGISEDNVFQIHKLLNEKAFTASTATTVSFSHDALDKQSREVDLQSTAGKSIRLITTKLVRFVKSARCLLHDSSEILIIEMDRARDKKTYELINQALALHATTVRWVRFEVNVPLALYKTLHIPPSLFVTGVAASPAFNNNHQVFDSNEKIVRALRKTIEKKIFLLSLAKPRLPREVIISFIFAYCF